MTDYTELKHLVDRVLNDRRFCGDENHKALADGLLALIVENEALRDDAERYRGVRRVANQQGYSDEQFDQQTDTRVARFDDAMGNGEKP